MQEKMVQDSTSLMLKAEQWMADMPEMTFLIQSKLRYFGNLKREMRELGYYRLTDDVTGISPSTIGIEHAREEFIQFIASFRHDTKTLGFEGLSGNRSYVLLDDAQQPPRNLGSDSTDS